MRPNFSEICIQNNSFHVGQQYENVICETGVVLSLPQYVTHAGQSWVYRHSYLNATSRLCQSWQPWHQVSSNSPSLHVDPRNTPHHPDPQGGCDQWWDRMVEFITKRTIWLQLFFITPERTAPYKWLRGIQFVNTIPKNPSGKILRRALRNQIAANVAKHQRTAWASYNQTCSLGRM